MFELPEMKEIEVNGKTIRYTMPRFGRIEAERPASWGPPGFVFSEFIDAKVGKAIAAKEGRSFENYLGSNEKVYPWGRVH